MIRKIRRAIETDGDAVADMLAAAEHEVGKSPPNFSADEFRRIACGPHALVNILIAEHDDAPVGYAAFYNGYDFGAASRKLYLAELYVSPTERRHGFGRLLIAATAKIAIERCAVAIYWNMSPRNIAGRKFYETLGAGSDPVLDYSLDCAAIKRLSGECPPDFGVGSP